jgi:hypothetical protein
MTGPDRAASRSTVAACQANSSPPTTAVRTSDAMALRCVGCGSANQVDPTCRRCSACKRSGQVETAGNRKRRIRQAVQPVRPRRGKGG